MFELPKVGEENFEMKGGPLNTFANFLLFCIASGNALAEDVSSEDIAEKIRTLAAERLALMQVAGDGCTRTYQTKFSTMCCVKKKDCDDFCKEEKWFEKLTADDNKCVAWVVSIPGVCQKTCSAHKGGGGGGGHFYVAAPNTD